MPPIRAEPIAFGIAWVAFAFYAGLAAGWQVGAAISVGLMLLLLPLSTMVLTRTDNFQTERLVRWSVLILAAAAFLIWQNR